MVQFWEWHGSHDIDHLLGVPELRVEDRVGQQHAMESLQVRVVVTIKVRVVADTKHHGPAISKYRLRVDFHRCQVGLVLGAPSWSKVGPMAHGFAVSNDRCQLHIGRQIAVV